MFCMLFGGGIFWYLRGDICERRVEYYVGSIDKKFDISEEELLSVIDQAASVWEESVGHTVFTYVPDSKVAINLVFDERQEKTRLEQQESSSIDNSGDRISTATDALDRDEKNIERLEQEYQSLQNEYNKASAKLSSLKSRANSTSGAAQYNNQVSKVNGLISLLQQKQAQLNTAINSFNGRVKSTQRLVNNHNDSINSYNSTFTSEEDFDKGDYGSNVVSIYQYENNKDLALVIAHELGHVLGLDHVENPDSIMYYTLEEQNTNNMSLSDEDIEELGKRCSL